MMPAVNMIARSVLVAVLLAVAGLALAREAAPRADDPAVEARLVAIADELRCLVCQNESLASSHAELAEDLRREVRGLIREGKSDTEIKRFLVDRYGDFVLYRPEVKPLTWALWFGPFALLVLALVVLVRYLRQRREHVPRETTLSEAERARAEQLLKD
jgi:cytochrome c-type biogenesis protein CcmH